MPGMPRKNVWWDTQHMCMMESTYAIANSIAGVSGVVQADADEIITVPGNQYSV